MQARPPVNKLLFAAFLSAVFFMAPGVLGLLGMPLGYICPLPLIWTYLAHGRESGRKTLLMALVFALLLAALFSNMALGLSFIYHLGLAWGMGEAICGHKTRPQMMAWGILAGCAANLLLMLGTAL